MNYRAGLLMIIAASAMIALNSVEEQNRWDFFFEYHMHVLQKMLKDLTLIDSKLDLTSGALNENVNTDRTRSGFYFDCQDDHIVRIHTPWGGLDVAEFSLHLDKTLVTVNSEQIVFGGLVRYGLTSYQKMALPLPAHAHSYANVEGLSVKRNFEKYRARYFQAVQEGDK